MTDTGTHRVIRSSTWRQLHVKELMSLMWTIIRFFILNARKKYLSRVWKKYICGILDLFTIITLYLAYAAYYFF